MRIEGNELKTAGNIFVTSSCLKNECIFRRRVFNHLYLPFTYGAIILRQFLLKELLVRGWTKKRLCK